MYTLFLQWDRFETIGLFTSRGDCCKEVFQTDVEVMVGVFSPSEMYIYCTQPQYGAKSRVQFEPIWKFYRKAVTQIDKTRS